MKLIKILTAIFLSALFLYGADLYASTKLEYYQNEFKNWGIETDADGLMKEELGDSMEEVDLVKIFILLSSNLVDEISDLNSVREKYERLIVICDTELVFEETGAACSFYASTANLNSMVSLQINESNSISFVNFQHKNLDVFLVPESYFVTAEYSSVLRSYFQAVNRGDLVLESIGNESNELSFIRENIDRVINTTLFELFSYVFFLVLFILILYKGFVSLKVSSPIDSYEIFYNKVTSFPQSKITLYGIWIFLLLGLAPVFAFIVMKVGIQPNLVLNYILASVNPQNYSTMIEENNLSWILFLVYLYSLSILSIVIIVPETLQVFHQFHKKLSNTSLKVGNLIKFYVTLWISSALLLSFFDLSNIYIPLSGILLVITYISYLFYKNDVVIVDFIQFKDRVYIVSAVGLILLGGLIYNQYFQIDESMSSEKSSLDYVDTGLIGVDDPIVMTPYLKVHNPNELFTDIEMEILNPIFIDDMLVFYPGFNDIHNTSIEGFETNRSFYVRSENLDEIVDIVLRNPMLTDILSTEQVTRDFYLPELMDLSDDSYLSITFDCRGEIHSGGINLRNYFLEEGEIQINANSLLNFPGCSNSGVETINIPIDVVPNLNGESIYSLVGFLSRNIIELVIISGDDVFYPTYLNIEGTEMNYSISNIIEGETLITNYIFDEIEDFTISNIGSNIALPINELKLNGEIGESFLISSPGKNVIIKNDYANVEADD